MLVENIRIMGIKNHLRFIEVAPFGLERGLRFVRADTDSFFCVSPSHVVLKRYMYLFQS